MKDSGFGSFLAGAVIGGLIGAAVGLLLAPTSGQRTREQVSEIVDGTRTALGEAVSEGRAAAEKARAEMLGAYDAPAIPDEGAASEGAAS